MNLTQIENQIEALQPELDRAQNRMHEIEPTIKNLEKELKEKKNEFDYLNRNIVYINQQLKKLHFDKRKVADREAELRANQSYEEGYKEIPDFFEAIEEPLSKWLTQNESIFFGMIKPNVKNIITRMKKEDWEYLGPKVMPNQRMADLISAKNRYYQLSKEIVRLEIDTPESWQLDKNLKEMLLRDNFASLFRVRVFKEWF